MFINVPLPQVKTSAAPDHPWRSHLSCDLKASGSGLQDSTLTHSTRLLAEWGLIKFALYII